MVEIEDLYRPFQEQLERYSLIDSLAVIHGYMQTLQFGQSLPNGIEMHPEVQAVQGYARNFYEWQLDLLSRELIQHAPMNGFFSLAKWNEFANAINALKHLEEKISERTGRLLERNILIEIGRTAYRQFPWQQHRNTRILTRYLKIFGHPAMAPIVEERLGLTPNELYLLGLAFTGHFLTTFAYRYPVNYDAIGISDEKRNRFVRHFSTPLSTLKQLAANSQWHNENFAYSQNPLRIFPLVHVGLGGNHHIIAPIPTYLFDRFTAGVYYELYDHPAFSKAFGASFQHYVGEVLSKVLPKASFEILPEQEYKIGKDRKDSIDWIVRDDSGTLFIECKTKRMRLSSKTALVDITSLTEDVEKISEFVFQTYKSIVDAEAGRYPHWKPDGKPIYPAVVLLEDWYLFDFKLTEVLKNSISAKLTAQGMNPVLLEKYPYVIVSCADFELLTQVVGKVDIQSVLSKKHERGDLRWNVAMFLKDEFGAEVSKIGKRPLFAEEMEAIHPAMALPADDEKTTD